MAQRELVLGGARSGKSAHALAAARQHGDAVTWIATATAGDAEMAARIVRHQAERPAAWRTVEAPLALGTAVDEAAEPGRCVVVDCLTLWLSNLLCADDEAQFTGERQALLDAVDRCGQRLILISNEVGWGIVPGDALSRRFRDEAGRLHQELAVLCERVLLVVAGIPIIIKPIS